MLALLISHMVVWMRESYPPFFSPLITYGSWPWGLENRRAIPALICCSTQESRPCTLPA